MEIFCKRQEKQFLIQRQEKLYSLSVISYREQFLDYPRAPPINFVHGSQIQDMWPQRSAP